MENELNHILGDVCFAFGSGCHAVEKYEEAESWYEKALISWPDHIRAAEGMMYAKIMQRKFREAIPYCTFAANDIGEMKRDLAIYNRGLCELMIGDYINGFKDYDTRMRMGKTVDLLRKKIGTRPLWDGKSCDHLLVYGEQGMGDLFMFSRYIKSLQHIKSFDCDIEINKITFEVPEQMLSFMKHNFQSKLVNVLPQTEEVTKSDEHMLLVSLPKIFKTTLEKIPNYKLYAEPAYIDKWQYIADMPGLKVGLCWAGRSEKEQDLQVKEWNSRRSIHLSEMTDILSIPGISFVSLQKGIDEKQADAFPNIKRPNIESWSDTAGIMHHLDLIISIDSGPVHLSGALGKETWLLNHLHTCWRWGLTETQSNWYNSVMIFRQYDEGDWSYPVQQISNALKRYTESLKAA